MKKYFKLLTVISVILFALSFVSCGLLNSVKESVEDSYNQWYKYDKGDKTFNIPVVASEADDSENGPESGNLKNADIYLMFNPDAGLTVAIQTVTEQNVEVLGGLVENRMDLVVGSTKTYTTEQFGKGKWTALWLSGKLIKDSAPKICTDSNQCINLNSEDGPKIQWKKFLANYLLKQFIED